MRHLFALLVGFALVTPSLDAQVTASQAAPSSRAPVEVPDPMQIDIPLGAGEGRLSLEGIAPGKYLSYPEVSYFQCDKARVRMLSVRKVSEDAQQVNLEASVLLVTEWPLQEVALNLEMVSATGETVFSRKWPRIKLGTWSKQYKAAPGALKAPIVVRVGQWRELFADGKAPTMRVVLDVL
jgi:hypothetical protein